MYVTGSAYRDFQRIAQPNDRPVIVSKLLLIPGSTIMNHEHIVLNGLNFQKIIEFGNRAKFAPALSIHHCPEQLARLTGASQNEPLPVTDQLAFRDAGLFIEIIQMGFGHQLIKVFQSGQIFDQDNLMIRVSVFIIDPG